LMWTRRSTEAWSDHSSTWRRRGRTSNSQYVCALIFKRLQGLRIGVKCIFRYLRYTLDFGLWYSASSSLALHGFSDVDFAGCQLDKKSTSGTCKFLGSSLVCWSSANCRVLLNPLPRQSMWLQLVVALSSFGSHTP
jgi:hypothetical protein